MRKFTLFFVLSFGALMLLATLIFGFSGFLFSTAVLTGIYWCFLFARGLYAAYKGKVTAKKVFWWVVLIFFVLPAVGLYLGFMSIAVIFI